MNVESIRKIFKEVMPVLVIGLVVAAVAIAGILAVRVANLEAEVMGYRTRLELQVELTDELVKRQWFDETLRMNGDPCYYCQTP